MAKSALNSAIRHTSRLWKRQKLASLRADNVDRTGQPTVVGLFRVASGIGSGARVVFRALQASGYNPALIDLSDQLAPGQPVFDWQPPAPAAADDGCGPVIVHLNPPEVPFALSRLGTDRLRHRYRIGIWAWELELMPTDWQGEVAYFHEIWAPSEFTASAIRSKSPNASVSCVHYPLAADQFGAVDVDTWRRRLAPEGERIVFCAFDARSSMARKNPAAAIEIFKAAVGERTDVRLVLKVSNLDWNAATRRDLLEQIGKDPRIQLLTATLGTPDMNALISAADIYLSPHRSEGFGFMLVKSLMAGVDVMMTNWSGNTDFMDLPGAHPIGCQLVAVNDASGIYNGTGRWAEPDTEMATPLLRDLLGRPRDPARRAEIAAAAASRFSSDGWAQRLSPQFKAHTLQGESASPI
ncbi:glycosyltransferase [Maricaulis maris]|uniref:glycosyltransferase n=1 Tax=Maricaulis maris TaxID=74318 RepID=UPI003B8ABEF7